MCGDPASERQIHASLRLPCYELTMAKDFQADIQAIQWIDAVPSILEVVCRTTGMGFAAIARVTEQRWIACAVKDDIRFGLEPGGELKVETTICHEIRQSGSAVVIDHVAEDQAFCGHPTPAMYGFQSYISMPIVRTDGSFFGTLCAIDPRPAVLKTPQTIAMF
jgi:GAF domain-containing protein